MDSEEHNGVTAEKINYNGTVVVIPTRNRAQIAMNAVRSVLDQPVENLQILVSDNSTSDHEREELASFCSALSDSRVRYLSPPQPLAMSAHWEWAIEQALALYGASHFIYLTDRMMFRAGALKDLLDRVALYPDKVISYNHDRIVDYSTPIRIEQYSATEKLLEVETQRFSWLFSQAIFSHALPRMLNSVAPRAVLERMRRRFGSIFSSIAPDFNFCCRCLEIEDSILFYDKALIFHYALDRSNGASWTRGEVSSDNADFTANLPATTNGNYATPIPQLMTTVNCAFHEYILLKRETNSPRFFEVNLKNYLEVNAAETREVIDPRVRAEMFALLVEHGYEGPLEVSPTAVPVATTWRRWLREGPKNLRLGLKEAVSAPVTKPAWLFLARNLGVTPPGETGFEFRELDEAIDYARNISRGNFKESSGHAELLQARELSIPGQGPESRPNK